MLLNIHNVVQAELFYSSTLVLAYPKKVCQKAQKKA